MTKKVSDKTKKLWFVIVFVIGLLFFLFNVYQIPLVKNKIPWLDNQIQAYKYSALAKKLPPGDLKTKRLRAMAESLRKGDKDYQFETGTLPPIGQ